MSFILNSYHVYCKTEQTYIQQWATSAITACPNDEMHEIDFTTLQTLNTIHRLSVPTGGNMQISSFVTDIPAGAAGDVTEKTFSYPFPINIGEISFSTDIGQIGDQVSMAVEPNSEIGILTSDVSANSIIISIDPIAVTKLCIGYFIDLDDGVNNDTLGPCVKIDLIQSTITCAVATVHSFSSTNTKVRMSIQLIDNLFFGPSHRYVIGSSNLVHYFMPANRQGRIAYKNNSTTQKTFVLYVSYFY